MVVNRKNGFVWWSNPPGRDNDKIAQGVWKMSMSSQLLLEYTDLSQNFQVNSFVGSVKKDGLKIERIPNGISVTYGFPRQEFSIPVHYTITDDYFKSEIIASKIEEGANEKLLNIGLLPYFGAGGVGDEGYLMVPDGSGALINFNNNKGSYDEYSQPIYGKDNTFNTQLKKDNTDEIKMPVFGEKNGENGFIAVITNGDGLAKINAAVSGKLTSYNNIYSEFGYRSQDTVGLGNKQGGLVNVIKLSDMANNEGNYEVRYYFLEGKESDYSGMARRYQKYLTEECGFKSRVYTAGFPFFLDVYGSITKQKSIFGIPFHITEALTTYDECIKLIDLLRLRGIDNIVLKYDNCIRNYQGKIPSVFNAENRLGGIKAFNRLCSYLKANSIRFFPNIDFVKYYKYGNGFSVYGDSSKTINNVPSEQVAFKLSTLDENMDVHPWYLLSPIRVIDAVKKFIGSLKKTAVNSICLDNIGNQVYSDFGKRQVNRIKAIEIWENSMDFIKKQSDLIMVSDANVYTFHYADYIVDVPVTYSYFDIEDESIPFYQMVLHGFIQYATPSINLSSNPEHMLLKALETGSCLKYSWIWRDNTLLKETEYDYLYSVNYKAWFEKAVRNYLEVKPVLMKISNQRIVSHKKLVKNVYETEYENGVKIVVNYSDLPIKVLGKEVKGDSYLLLENE